MDFLKNTWTRASIGLITAAVALKLGINAYKKITRDNMAKTKDRPNIKDDKRYEALKKTGMSKQKAARIANSDASATGRKGGKTSNLDELSRQELYNKAKEYNIPNRSKMTKEELVKALRKGK